VASDQDGTRCHPLVRRTPPQVVPEPSSGQAPDGTQLPRLNAKGGLAVNDFAEHWNPKPARVLGLEERGAQTVGRVDPVHDEGARAGLGREDDERAVLEGAGRGGVGPREEGR
jgi:hypothetical protein